MGKKEEIIKATGAILAQDGYLGVSLKRVAKNANLSLKVVKKKFKTKEALCIAAIEDAYDDLYGQLSVASQAGIAIQDKIFNIIVAYSSFIIKRPEAKLIIKEGASESALDQEINKLQLKLLSFFKKVIKKAEKQNQQPSSVFFVTASLVFSLISRPLLLLKSSTRKLTKQLIHLLFAWEN